MARSATPTDDAPTDDNTGTSTSSDPRRPYIYCGTDDEGADHLYHTDRERVIVIKNGEREYVQPLNGKTIHDWMDYVAEKRAWVEKRMHRDATKYLARQLADRIDG